MKSLERTTVGVCETQPVTAEGLSALLSACPDLELVRVTHSLQGAVEMVLTMRPAVVLVDKALGIHGLLEWLIQLRTAAAPTAIAVWGAGLTEADALRFVQAGARGVMRKSAQPAQVLACLRAVGSGITWMEEGIFRESPRVTRLAGSELTPREQQVLELVRQGLKNAEIGRELGIRPGTVKIHLKHVFEKTGIRDRYGLALSGLQEHPMPELASV